MIHPIPPGTRDVLPDEMRELRAITDALQATFAGAGYGEVWTPAVEYEDVLRAGDADAAGAGYRLFDDQGHVLALRSDMTIPIARVAATRFPDAAAPLRLCYLAHAYRAVGRGSGQQREFLQGGCELIGVAGPQGEAEVISLTARGARGRRPGAPPDRAGRRRAVPRSAARAGSARGRARRSAAPPVGARPRGPRAARGPARAVGARRARCWWACPSCAAAPRCWSAPPGMAGAAVDGLAELYAALEPSGAWPTA